MIDNTWAPGWPAMNFCRTFRNTALKEIEKIYTVWGRKFFLSFPVPYTCVFFSVQLSRGFSRLPQRESLLAGYIHTSEQPQFLRWNESAGNLVAFLTTWPLFTKPRTWVLNVAPRQSAVSSLTNLWATKSMRMILTPMDCERKGESRIVAKLKASSVVL